MMKRMVVVVLIERPLAVEQAQRYCRAAVAHTSKTESYPLTTVAIPH
jgi:hypothetical protein